MRNLKWIHWLLLAIVAALAIPMAASAQVSVGISVRVGPPPLRVYEQPFCPGPGYIWTPGYWAYGPDGYYWVPGEWVLAPEPGLLWTPGYWAFGEGVYVWHRGYWGPHVGYYGGIHYGYGYTGVGYEGGRWNHGVFFYNRSVNRVNVTVIHNTYERRVVVRDDHHYSFNGHGGVERHENRDERRWENDRHFEATAAQRDREHFAAEHRDERAEHREARDRDDRDHGDFKGRDSRDRGFNNGSNEQGRRDERFRGNDVHPGNPQPQRFDHAEKAHGNPHGNPHAKPGRPQEKRDHPDKDNHRRPH